MGPSNFIQRFRQSRWEGMSVSEWKSKWKISRQTSVIPLGKSLSNGPPILHFTIFHYSQRQLLAYYKPSEVIE